MSAVNTYSDVNARFLSLVQEPEGIVKAAQATNHFIRTRVREEGAARKILEPQPVTTEDFAPQVDTDQPVIVGEMEPGSPGAVTMPFGQNTPPSYYMRGRKYRAVLQRISSPMMRKDEAELATYRTDIQQLFAEIIVKDLSWEEDATFIYMCNTVMGGGPGGTNLLSGLVHWYEIEGGLSRVTLGDSFKLTVVPPSRIPIKTLLWSPGTLAELWKFDLIETGGQEAQTIFFDGWGDRTINGCTGVTSIKRELIPDDTIYFFGPNTFFGKFYVWQEPQIYIKKEDTEVQFRAHEIVGMVIAHADGLFRFDYVTT